MATFLLDGKSTATLPRRALEATLATSTGVQAGIRLRAAYADGPGAPQVVAKSATVLILPTVDRAITLHAVPDGGPQFAEGTVLHLSIGSEDSRHGDGDRAQVAQITVSGLETITLATVTPGAGDSLVVASSVPRDELPLPELAALARVAARGVLGPEAESGRAARSVRLVVDRSVSMLSLHASGAVAAAGDIVAGIAATIGDDGHITVLDAARTTGDGAARKVELGAVGADLEAGAPGLGISPRLDVACPGGELTVVVTDGAGAAVVAAEPRAGTVVLALTDARSIAGRPGFAGALCPVPRGEVPGGDARTALVQRPELVRAVVVELLAAAGVVAAR